MPNLFKRIYAILFLGTHFLTHWLKKPFHYGKGLKRFMASYAPDRIYALSTLERVKFSQFTPCINCGLCDSSCPSLQNISRSVFRGPSYIVNTVSRHLSDFVYIDWATNPCVFCKEYGLCEEACPKGIPIGGIIDFVRSKAGFLRQGKICAERSHS